MKIYLIEDEDTGECHAFKTRKSAINKAFNRCNDWCAILYIPQKKPAICMSDYIEFGLVYSTDEEKLQYLYSCTDTELNKIFEEYWYFRELDLNE